MENSTFLSNFDILNKTGLIDEVEDLRNTIAEQSEILDAATQIFEKHSQEELFDYVISKFLNKFIPSYLIFFIEDYFNTDKSNIL